MPNQVAKACMKCSLAINEPGNTSFYHAACNPRPEQRAEHDKFRAQQEYRQFYNTVAWKRLRQRVLAEEPICDICKRAASTVADHKNDHKGNWLLFISRHNVHGVCKPCHDKKTGTEHGFGTPSTPSPGGVAPGVVTAAPTVMGQSFVPTPAPVENEPPAPRATVMGIPFMPAAAPSDKSQATRPEPRRAGPPSNIKVEPAHQHLPDGQVAFKKEYGRFYRKVRDRWVLQAEDFQP